MNKVMLFTILALLLFPIISAQTVNTVSDETELVFKQFNVVDLKISCLDENNSLCVPSTFCQLTVNRPDMTNLIDGENMTYNLNYYNYTFSSDEMSVSGRYSAFVRCQGTSSGFSTFSFLITHDGIDPTEGRTTSYFVILIVVLALAIALIIFGTMSRKFLFNIMGGMIMMLLGTFLLASGVPGIDNLFLTNGIGIVILGIGAYFTVFESLKFGEPNYGYRD